MRHQFLTPPAPVISAIAAPMLSLLPSAAAAHGGHIARAAGHDHWAAAVVICLAVFAGIWGLLQCGTRGVAVVIDTEDRRA